MFLGRLSYDSHPDHIGRDFRASKKTANTPNGGIETVIDLLATFYERQNGGPAAPPAGAAQAPVGPHPAEFNPSAPPDLTHTRVLSVELNGQQLPRELAKWNKILDRTVIEAKSKMATAEELKRLLVVNAVVGKKEDMGYHYLDKAGVSVQGQDANGAWRATFHIVKALGFRIDLVFAWANKEGVSNAGVTGRFLIDK
jgi:hypothetical protein